MNIDWIIDNFLIGLIAWFLLTFTNMFMSWAIEVELEKHPEQEDGWWLRMKAARKPILTYAAFILFYWAECSRDENTALYHRNIFWFKNVVCLCLLFTAPVIILKIFLYTNKNLNQKTIK